MPSPRTLIVSTGLLTLGVVAANLAGPTVALASAATTSVAATTSAAGSAPHYAKIVEPFSAPGPTCTSADTTLAISSCLLVRVVQVDDAVNVLQQDRFTKARTTKAKKALLLNDSTWLKARSKDCAAHNTGGSIDRITDAQCLLGKSKQRATSLVNAI